MAGISNIGPTFLAINWTCFGIVTIVVGLRLYSRAFRLGRLHSDDYMMIMAWILSLLYGTMLSDAVGYGLGEHIDRVTTSGWRRIGIEIAVSRGLAIVIPWLVRVSFSFTLFLVIRGTRHDKLRWLIWSNVVVETVVSLIGIIIIYSHCGHDSSRYARGFVCRPTEKVDYYSYIHSGINCLSNIALAGVPFWLIHRMKLPRDVKNGTIVLSILGFACSAASIAKAVETRAMSGAKKDITWDYAMLQLATTLENSILMILCSLPLLRPLYKHDQNRGTIPIPITTRIGRTTPTPASVALRDQAKLRIYQSEKETDSQKARSSTSEDHILGATSAENQRDSLDDADIPPDRIKVRTAVDVTYEQANENEQLDTDEIVQQRIMFGL